jgi:hypothetical protein
MLLGLYFFITKDDKFRLLWVKFYQPLNESLVKWFQDYISNRKQIVFINNSESRIGLLKAGIPQGSVLVPLLFLIETI